MTLESLSKRIERARASLKTADTTDWQTVMEYAKDTLMKKLAICADPDLTPEQRQKQLDAIAYPPASRDPTLTPSWARGAREQLLAKLEQISIPTKG